MTFIIQYFEHPSVIFEHVKRLQHPELHVIVHADSNTTADHEALSRVARKFPDVALLYSQDLHELRGYNNAALHAEGDLLAFSQDDRLPPRDPGGWVDATISMFDTMPPTFALLSFYRGSTKLWKPHAWQSQLGACDAQRANEAGGRVTIKKTARMRVEPLEIAAHSSLGPLIFRRDAFFGTLGVGFDERWSAPGAPALGFDMAATAELWLRNRTAAVLCPSQAFLFRNGCGGRGSRSNKAQLAVRKRQAKRNALLYAELYGPKRKLIERLVAAENAQLLLLSGGGSSPPSAYRRAALISVGCADCRLDARDFLKAYRKDDLICGDWD